MRVVKAAIPKRNTGKRATTRQSVIKNFPTNGKGYAVKHNGANFIVYPNRGVVVQNVGGKLIEINPSASIFDTVFKKVRTNLRHEI